MIYSKIKLVGLQLGCVFLMIIVGISMIGWLIQGASLAQMFLELAHMRMIMSILVVLIHSVVIAILMIGVVILQSIKFKSVFTDHNIQRFKLISYFSLFEIALFVSVIIYTNMNMVGAITNVHAFLGAVVFLLVALLFQLFAALFDNAKNYKQEVELTV